ncbi:MAG: hypothetical protein J6X18_05635 [Bacteroidales bacterium]|nr:hypothetical protein [Bacteroidales bacterium]
MNRNGGRDSEVTLSVPYNYGDPKVDFRYSGAELTEQKYSRMMVDTYNRYKDGVYDMFMNNRLGTNIASYEMEKENNVYTQQKFYFEESKVDIYNGASQEMTIDELIHYYQTREPFVIIINMYGMVRDPEDGGDPELETSMKGWSSEALKILRCNRFSDAEKIQYQSKKSLKLKFDKAQSQAILQNCKMIDVKNKTTFVFLVEKIIFVRN